MVLENSASWESTLEHDDSADTVPELGGGVPLIKVVGIGGGGSNAVSRMFKEKLPVVEYYGVNTDAQHLFRCDVAHRIAIGQNLTRGLGAGANPDLGRQAAEESRGDIEEALGGADMVFPCGGNGRRHRHRSLAHSGPDRQGERRLDRGRGQQALLLRSRRPPQKCR